MHFFQPKRYETTNQLQGGKVGKHKHVDTKQMLLKNHWVNEEVKEETRKYLETNENKNTTFENLWDTAKAVLRRKFRAIQAYLKKQNKKSQTT